jgi:hypothetical protein
LHRRPDFNAPALSKASAGMAFAARQSLFLHFFYTFRTPIAKSRLMMYSATNRAVF